MLRQTVLALCICAALVALCYFVLDRPIAYFVYEHGLSRTPGLKWLTYPPPVVEAWVPLLLVALVTRRGVGPLRRWEVSLLAACVSLVLAERFRNSLGYVFGRTWPEPWIDDNPSLIRDGVSCFHFFHGGEGYASFPSGHTARTTAATAVFWVAYPRWRWLCVAVPASVAVGLLGMNYHFLGDVVAGGFLGGIVGVHAAYLSGLPHRPPVAAGRAAH
jgi:membrane-associated phospholipid phosphatase